MPAAVEMRFVGLSDSSERDRGRPLRLGEVAIVCSADGRSYCKYPTARFEAEVIMIMIKK